MSTRVLSIVSGGQTGADRAALDWAVAHEVPHGGWCPKGRKAEDGSIDPRYQLQECPSAEYVRRTEMNVRNSDGTVIFTVRKVLIGGSRRTADFARLHGRPCLHLSALADGQAAPKLLRDFWTKQGQGAGRGGVQGLEGAECLQFCSGNPDGCFWSRCCPG